MPEKAPRWSEKQRIKLIHDTALKNAQGHYGQLMNEIFFSACKNGNIEGIKEILMDPFLAPKIDLGQGMIHSAEMSQIKTLDFLLNTNFPHTLPSKIKKHELLPSCCTFANMKMIKYVANFFDIDKYRAGLINSSSLNSDLLDRALLSSATFQRLDVLIFLLTSKKFKELVRPHSNNDALFQKIATNKPIRDFLIFDYGLKLTPDIKEFLISNKMLDILTEYTAHSEKAALTSSLNTKSKKDKLINKV